MTLIWLSILTFAGGAIGAFVGSLVRSHRYDPTTRSLVLRENR